MNFNNPFGIEYRLVNEIEHNGLPARCVSGSRIYDTDCDDLWDALTNPVRIPNWFLPVSGELELGGRYQLEGNAGGEITHCRPPEEFDATWEYANNVSWLVVRLKPEDGGTRLTLQHIMGKDDASEEHWRKFGPGATGVGWDIAFLGIGVHLRTGQAVDQEEAQQWLTTDQGKDFMRDSAKAWGDAHIESGEDPQIATTMAEETVKAYTGEG